MLYLIDAILLEVRTFLQHFLSFKTGGLLLLVLNSGCSAIVYELPRAAAAVRLQGVTPTLSVSSAFVATTATFSSTDTNHSYFQCKVDGEFDWSVCTSPFSLTSLFERGFEGTLRTRSIGIAGDAGPSRNWLPMTRRWSLR